MTNDVAQIAADLKNILNSHGYAFHQAVLHLCWSLQRQRLWRFLQSECPVELNGKVTHIDFILQHDQTRALIVAECKRADPAKARWCFVRTYYNRGGERPDNPQPIVSSVVLTKHPDRYEVEERALTVSPGVPFQLAFEMRSNAPGDGVKTKSLKETVDQVFRGTSGLIQSFKDSGGVLLRAEEPCVLFPVVFTTAKLFMCTTNLMEAELTTGNLEHVHVMPTSWLWYQANLSRDLRPHGVPVTGVTDDGRLETYIRLRQTRAACIVNVEAIPDFLYRLASPGALTQI